MATQPSLEIRPKSRVDEAAGLLSQLEPGPLAQVILERLEQPGRDERLPAPHRAEEPSQIFIDVARAGDESLITKLRAAAALLMNDLRQGGLNSNPQPLGEVCYLSAVLGASEALPQLAEIIRNDESESAYLGNGENLRLRALRSLVGLLGDDSSAAAETDIEQPLEHVLMHPQYRLLALTGLVGLKPERRDELLKKIGHVETGEALDASLEWAGFKRPEPAPE